MRQASAGFGNGTGKVLEIAAIVEKCDGTLDQIAFAVGRAGVVAKHDEGNVGCGLAHRAQHLQTGPAFELDVQHYDLGLAGQNAGDAGLGGGSLPHHGHGMFTQEGGHARTDRGRIIGQEYTCESRECHEPHCDSAMAS